MNPKVTRAAVITPPGEGGIGIIALCGPQAAEILDKVFAGTRRRASSLPCGAIAHGTIRRDGKTVDEVIVARPGAGHNSPGKPYFEVNCHGGTVAVQTVLTCLQEAGAEAVGWQDLASHRAEDAAPLCARAIRARAEAELPQAPTRLAAVMLLHQANGALSRELTHVARLLAASPSSSKGGPEQPVQELSEARTRLDALIRTARLGRALLRPPRVALLGPANVGKSTLLNALLEEERAIVHHEPGTTRDIVTEMVSLRGVPFKLMDSAGIRPTSDDVETHAVRRATRLASACDVALLIFDARCGLQGSLTPLPPLRKGTDVILVGNKIDLLDGGPSCGEPPPQFKGCPVVYISAKVKTNLNELEAALLRPFEDMIRPCRDGGPVLFDEQWREALLTVRNHLSAGQAHQALSALTEFRLIR